MSAEIQVQGCWGRGTKGQVQYQAQKNECATGSLSNDSCEKECSENFGGYSTFVFYVYLSTNIQRTPLLRVLYPYSKTVNPLQGTPEKEGFPPSHGRERRSSWVRKRHAIMQEKSRAVKKGEFLLNSSIPGNKFSWFLNIINI